MNPSTCKNPSKSYGSINPDASDMPSSSLPGEIAHPSSLQPHTTPVDVNRTGLSSSNSLSHASLVTLAGSNDYISHEIKGQNVHFTSEWEDYGSEESPLLGPRESSPESMNSRMFSLSRTEKSGAMIVLFALFVAESSRGMVIPTMTPYILHLGGTAGDIGIAVSVFSIGKLLSAAPLGYFTEYTGSTRLALIYCALFSAAANVFYACAYLSNSIWILLASRFLLGLSTGVMGIGRAYMAAAATAEVAKFNLRQSESPLGKYISWSGLVQYLGFSLTPIVSAVFKSKPDNDHQPNNVTMSFAGKLIGVSPSSIVYTLSVMGSELGIPNSVLSNLNMNPPAGVNVPIIDCILPAYFLAFMNVALVLLLFIFMDHRDPNIPSPEQSHSVPSSAKTNSPTLKGSQLEPERFRKEHLASKASLLSTTSTDTRIEEPKAADLIDPTALRIAFFVFFYMNFAIRGIIGVVEALAPLQYQNIIGPEDPNVSRDSAYYFTILGLFGLITFLTLDPFLKATRIHANYMLAVGIGFIATGSAFMIPEIHKNKLWIFTVGMMCVWAIGSPLCQTLTILSLSELVGRKPQAVIMSYLTNAGSLGRIIFPMLAGILPTPGIEICDIVLCVLSLIFTLCYHAWLEARIKQNSQRLIAGKAPAA